MYEGVCLPEGDIAHSRSSEQKLRRYITQYYIFGKSDIIRLPILPYYQRHYELTLEKYHKFSCLAKQ